MYVVMVQNMSTLNNALMPSLVVYLSIDLISSQTHPMKIGKGNVQMVQHHHCRELLSLCMRNYYSCEKIAMRAHMN